MAICFLSTAECQRSSVILTRYASVWLALVSSYLVISHSLLSNEPINNQYVYYHYKAMCRSLNSPMVLVLSRKPVQIICNYKHFNIFPSLISDAYSHNGGDVTVETLCQCVIVVPAPFISQNSEPRFYTDYLYNYNPSSDLSVINSLVIPK